MEQWIKDFVDRLHLEGKSDKTIKQYSASIKEYFQWFYESYGDVEFKKLYRENILEYKNYLKNIKRSKRSGNNLDAKSVNSKLSALIKFNELLQADNIVISKADLIKVQTEIISPTNITKKEVEEFRQRILQSEGCSAKRNYAIVTIMAYAGLRISEVLQLKKVDVNTTANQIRVTDGKGEKQRTVIINSKIVSAIREYQKSDQMESEYLFHNSKGKILNPSTINKVFDEFSVEGYHIHPHMLRHFFCYNALESGAYSINEVSNQAGHTSIKTTMRYLNPNLDAIKKKAELL
ncbi:tyrosine recombinase XerC [Lachnospiraceae bacterium]|jgi:Site-specific recombinase XerD|nr:tyrosine recombinase XerC [Lachnospiraceae bacterium]